MLRRRRSGYTWVELTVCIAILLFLLAMLLPALNRGRPIGRRSVCNNNLHQLGLAMQNYVSNSNRGDYPGYLGPLKLDAPAEGAGGGAAQLRRVTWAIPMLPLIERPDLYRAFRRGEFAERNPESARAQQDRLYIQTFICPSNVPTSIFPPPCSYVVNTGQVDVPAWASDGEREGYPADWPANGVFFNHFVDGQVNPAGAPLVTMTQDFIAEHDGTSNTLMASERLAAGSWVFPPAWALDAEAALGFVWRASPSNQTPFDPPLPTQRINGPVDPIPINNARPSSNHPGGVMVVFCDGHSRFISEKINYGVYCLLMTPDGRRCNGPGQIELVGPSQTNNYEYLRKEQVADSDLD